MRNLLRMWTSLRLYHDTFENQFLEVAVAVACNGFAWPVRSRSFLWFVFIMQQSAVYYQQEAVKFMSSTTVCGKHLAVLYWCCCHPCSDSTGVGACVFVQVPDYLLRVEKRFEEEVRSTAIAIQEPLLHSHGHVACSSPCGRATAWVPTLITLPAGP